MQHLSDDDHKAALGEVLLDELKIIREYLEAVLEDTPVIKRKVTKLEEDMTEVKGDIKVIKAAVTDQGRQVKNHEVRVTRLEAAR